MSDATYPLTYKTLTDLGLRIEPTGDGYLVAGDVSVISRLILLGLALQKPHRGWQREILSVVRSITRADGRD